MSVSLSMFLQAQSEAIISGPSSMVICRSLPPLRPARLPPHVLHLPPLPHLIFSTMVLSFKSGLNQQYTSPAAPAVVLYPLRLYPAKRPYLYARRPYEEASPHPYIPQSAPGANARGLHDPKCLVSLTTPGHILRRKRGVGHEVSRQRPTRAL